MHMATQKETLGYSGIYLERSGIDSAAMIDQLMSPPERPLSDFDKQAARQFESDMLSVEVQEGATLEDILQVPLSETSDCPMFFAEGFISGEVEVGGVDIPKFESPADVYKWLASADFTKQQLLIMSKQSTELYKRKVASALDYGGEIDERVAESMSVVADTEGFIDKVRKMRRARDVVLELKKSLSDDSDLDAAKRAYVDISLAKINSKIASAVPMVHHLREQAKMLGDDALAEVADGLVSRAMLRFIDSDEARRRIFRRLDFLRQGIGYSSQGEATSISSSIETGIDRPAVGGGVFGGTDE